ncbi:creatininase family protein [Aquabacterium sp. A7-Y]|uniref:creatininase family protein n=1 Tax=Aquabacterium sp. A7-Y TaxID=1349605 RepID=UPI00223E7FAA|nr:creatininase family protein [Aquabacterium sp. A7-Y]MCW7539135.1 creatininase family protein [Aquabacterium sp. A7-Y]
MARSTGPADALPCGHWQDFSTRDFARVDPERSVALLPVAAIEQHGPHLPLGTDALINEGVVRAALPRLPAGSSVLVLPALVVGDSLEHSAFPGTLNADLPALMGLWLSVGASVVRAGVRKLVIFNSHGGQRALVDQVALRLRVAHSMLVVRAHSFRLGLPPGLFEIDELAHGLHGGAVETSMLLHLRPDLVHTDRLADFPSLGRRLAEHGGLLGVEQPVGLGWMAQDLHPGGACGNAAAATAEKGARVVEHLADQLVQLLGEVARLPLATLRDAAGP